MIFSLNRHFIKFSVKIIINSIFFISLLNKQLTKIFNMKKLLIFVFALVATSASAQYYVGIGGGYAMPSAKTLMGTELNGTTLNTEYGSFGEGMNVTLKAGYFFNDKFGVELAAGYLHGADQVRDTYRSYFNSGSTTATTEILDATAYGRVFRIAPTLVYKITNNIYGKFGPMIPVGGKTVAEIKRSTSTPFGPVVVEGELEYKGKFGAGVTGTLGYQYNIGKNLNLFAEVEYIGLSVDRDTHTATALTIKAPAIPANALGAGHPGFAAYTWNLGSAPYVHPVFGTLYAPTEVTYVDNLPTTNTDPTKALGETAPYSSFGINFGVTYTFGK